MEGKGRGMGEGVVVMEESSRMGEVEGLGDGYGNGVGMEVFEMGMDGEEGYEKWKEWKGKVDGDVVLDWRKERRGKCVKVKGEKMGEMERIRGEVVGMEGGERREKKELRGEELKGGGEGEGGEEVKEEVGEVNRGKGGKDERIKRMKRVGKYVVDGVRGKGKGKENGVEEDIREVEVEVGREREKGGEEGGKEVLEGIVSGGGLKVEEVSGEKMGKGWRLWFEKGKWLEEEVKEVKEGGEGEKEGGYWGKMNLGNER